MPNKIHITLPNGHKYTVDDPSGAMTDVQAYQLVLNQDPDARNFMAQQKAQDKADHPWRDILSNAPSNLYDIGKGVVTMPYNLAKTAVSEVGKEGERQADAIRSGNTAEMFKSALPGFSVARAAYNTMGGPAIVDAGAEAIKHPSEILPAFKSGFQDQDVMNSTASNLALLPITEGITKNPVAAGRLITRPLAAASKVPDALAGSLGAQKGVMGIAGGTTVMGAEALGLPVPGGPIAGGVADLLGAKGGSMIGTTPAAEATELVNLAKKNLKSAVETHAGAPTTASQANVTAAADALKIAQRDAAKTTGVGKLATKAGRAMRAPDRMIQGQSAFPQPEVPPPPSIPMDGPVPPPAETWQSATNTPPPAPEAPPPPPPAEPPAPPPAPPAEPPPPPPPPSPFQSGMDLKPAAIEGMYQQSNPTFKAMEAAGKFGTTEGRSVGNLTPGAQAGPLVDAPYGRGIADSVLNRTPEAYARSITDSILNREPGSTPPITVPENPVIAADPKMQAADAASAAQREASGVTVDPAAQRAGILGKLGEEPPPLSDAEAARLTDAAPPQHVDPNAGIFEKATNGNGRYGPGSDPVELPPPGTRGVAPGGTPESVLQNAQRQGILDKLTTADEPLGGAVAPGGEWRTPLPSEVLPGEAAPQRPRYNDALQGVDNSHAANLAAAEADRVAGAVTPDSIAAAKAAAQAERAAAEKLTPGKTISDSGKFTAADFIDVTQPKALESGLPAPEGPLGGGQNDPAAIRAGLDALPPEGLTTADAPRGPGGRPATGQRAQISEDWKQAMTDAGLRTDVPGPIEADPALISELQSQMVESDLTAKDMARELRNRRASIDQRLEDAQANAATEMSDNGPAHQALQELQKAAEKNDAQQAAIQQISQGGRPATGARAQVSEDWKQAMTDAGLRTDKPGRLPGGGTPPGGGEPPSGGGPDGPPQPPPMPEAWKALADDLAKSENVHGANPDLTGDIPAERGTSADIRARIQERLKDPTSTMAEIRAQGGADRIGSELNANAPEASTGAVLRTGPQAPSWMPDDVQAAVLRDLQKDPATMSPDSLAKMQRAIQQLHEQYARNGGPRPTPIAQKLHEILTRRDGGKTGQGEPP